MPAWLIKILTKLLQPIVESIIEKLMIAARLSAIERKQQQQEKAFDLISKAKTPEDYQHAADALSDAWNK